MIVTDLSNSFNPCPKNTQKNSKKNVKKSEEEFCIMPKSKLYSTVRTEIYCERHEVYFSKAYRQKSIFDEKRPSWNEWSTWQKWRQA